MKINKNIVNQTVSPIELLAKLANIKTSGEISRKKQKDIKQLQQSLSFYEQYCSSTIEKLSVKLQNLNKEVSELKKQFKNVQNQGINKFDQLESRLQKTLLEYQNDQKKGQKMIREMVDGIEESMEKSILQKSLESSQEIGEYLKLNSRLESIIQSLKSMQSQLLSQYQNLRFRMSQKFADLSSKISFSVQQSALMHENLMVKLGKIEQECQNQIKRINDKKEKKRYSIHEMLQKIIQDAVENQKN